jgi:hypothetical protein
MRSIESHSASGREQEGKKYRVGSHSVSGREKEGKKDRRNGRSNNQEL